MTIEPIAHFHSPFPTKFGIPRQSGLAKELRGQIVFEPTYSNPDALRGLEGFDFLWLIWGFSANRPPWTKDHPEPPARTSSSETCECPSTPTSSSSASIIEHPHSTSDIERPGTAEYSHFASAAGPSRAAGLSLLRSADPGRPCTIEYSQSPCDSECPGTADLPATSPSAAPLESGDLAARKAFRPTVRPPRLGGNARVGVFASRSPFRPNGLGLSSVKIESIGPGPVINVLGADLMDGTPIYDIKPYVPYADSHPGVRGGFTDSEDWEKLEVLIPEGLEDSLRLSLGPEQLAALIEVLEQDPRPQYQDDPCKTYGMRFAGLDIRFRVEGGVLTVIEVIDWKRSN